MADAEVVDATVVDEPEPAGQEVVRAAPGGGVGVTPAVQAKELVARLDVIRDALKQAMVPNVDYGVIPGTDKPALFKPGAEKLGVLFQLDIQIECKETAGPGDHLTVHAQAIAYHAPTGARLGSGKGVCTTRERKYAYRQAQRTCPDCGKEAIIKGKQEYGGGWLCWKKRAGCGAKFLESDERITSQESGEIENPDLPDLYNTVVKMAEKRARVDCVLAVTGASALFTQDAPDEGKPAAADDAPGHGPAADEKLDKEAKQALVYVNDGDTARAKSAYQALTSQHDGYMPKAVAEGLIAAARAVRDTTGKPEPTTEAAAKDEGGDGG